MYDDDLDIHPRPERVYHTDELLTVYPMRERRINMKYTLLAMLGAFGLVLGAAFAAAGYSFPLCVGIIGLSAFAVMWPADAAARWKNKYNDLLTWHKIEEYIRDSQDKAYTAIPHDLEKERGLTNEPTR